MIIIYQTNNFMIFRFCINWDQTLELTMETLNLIYISKCIYIESCYANLFMPRTYLNPKICFFLKISHAVDTLSKWLLYPLCMTNV